MRITEIRVSLLGDKELKAFISIVLDGCFVVRGLKIVKGKHGLFVAMPSRRRREGGYRDICHPLDTRTRRWMEAEIMAKYRAVLEKNALVG